MVKNHIAWSLKMIKPTCKTDYPRDLKFWLIYLSPLSFYLYDYFPKKVDCHFNLGQKLKSSPNYTNKYTHS